MKGAVSAQKAFQGSETEKRELLGGTKEKSVSLSCLSDLPCRQINDFFYKKETEKIELVVRPVVR